MFRIDLRQSIVEEIYGSWHSNNNSLIDLRKVTITSRRRQNLNGTILNASMVMLNPDTINHLEDYAFVYSYNNKFLISEIILSFQQGQRN